MSITPMKLSRAYVSKENVCLFALPRSRHVQLPLAMGEGTRAAYGQSR